MIKRTILLIISAVVLILPAAALNIEASPGSLPATRETLRYTTEPMVVISGSADTEDLSVLSNVSSSVRVLDLRELSVSAIPPRMIMGCRNLGTVLLPNSVRTIGDEAFAATGIVTISLPESISEIGNYLFSDCSNLKEVTFKSTPSDGIGKGTFRNCSSLTAVTGLNTLSKIGDSTFDGCTSLNVAPSSFGKITEIGNYAFRRTALERLNLSGVKKIGDYAFAENHSLKELSLDLQASLGTGVFFHDENLSALPESSQLPALAMTYSGGDSLLVIRAANVGDGAFANNSAVSHLKFKRGVETVGAHAFRNLSSLRLIDAIDLGEAVPDADENAFSGLENEEGNYDATLFVSPTTGARWQAHPVWSRFKIDLSGDSSVSDITADFDANIYSVGNDIIATSPYPIQFIGVYSIDGMILHESQPLSEECRISDIDSDGIVIVKLISNSKVKVQLIKQR